MMLKRLLLAAAVTLGLSAAAWAAPPAPLFNLRTIVGSGTVTVVGNDYTVCINKTAGAPTAVTLPSSPGANKTFVIKDCKGDAATNPITITPGAGTIDGQANAVIGTNYGSLTVSWMGSAWAIVNSGNASGVPSVGVPAGANNSVQIKLGATTFSGIPLGLNQTLVGQSSGAPVATTLGSLATASVAPAGTLTGTALPSAIVSAPGLGSTSGHFFPFFDGANLWSGVNTFPNGDIRITGSGAGYTTYTSANAGATNYTWVTPAANGTTVFFGSGTPPTSGGCPQFTGVAGQVISITCPGSATLQVTDGINSPVANVTGIVLPGTVCSGATPNVTCAQRTTTRAVTASTTVAIGDMGNILRVTPTGAGVVVTIAAPSSTVFASGMQSTICNNSNQYPISISSAAPILGYPTTGSGPYVAVLPPLQGGVATCPALSSDGTSLQNNFSYPPNLILDNGTVSSGTLTVSALNPSAQKVTNNGAFTLAMAAFDGPPVTLRVTNGASAGAITFSGFSVGTSTGDALTTVNGSKFDITLTQIGGNPTYSIHQLQTGSITPPAAVAGTVWSNTSVGTSSPINDAGSNFSVVNVAYYNPANCCTATVTENNLGITLTPLTPYNSGNNYDQLFYCYCAGSSSHTFTVTGSSNITFGAAVESFSGMAGGSVDTSAESGASGGAAPTVTLGSITPTINGELLIAGLSNIDTGLSYTINNSFVVAQQQAFATNYGTGLAYRVQTTAAAIAPAWTISGGTTPSAASISGFKP